jgi:uncharacterized protein YidB (DUF937 family)
MSVRTPDVPRAVVTEGLDVVTAAQSQLRALVQSVAASQRDLTPLQAEMLEAHRGQPLTAWTAELQQQGVDPQTIAQLTLARAA